MADSAKLTVRSLFCSFERTGEAPAMLAAGREHAAAATGSHSDQQGEGDVMEVNPENIKRVQAVLSGTPGARCPNCQAFVTTPEALKHHRCPGK
jgi:hypothetical protein